MDEEEGWGEDEEEEELNAVDSVGELRRVSGIALLMLREIN